MKTTNIKLPAAFTSMSEKELDSTNGGFTLDAPVVIAGAAVLAVGVIGLNMLGWFKGGRGTNFIQDSINAGESFIQNSVNAGLNFLDKLMGK